VRNYCAKCCDAIDKVIWWVNSTIHFRKYCTAIDERRKVVRSTDGASHCTSRRERKGRSMTSWYDSLPQDKRHAPLATIATILQQRYTTAGGSPAVTK
jgi:hypothetical protein